MWPRSMCNTVSRIHAIMMDFGIWGRLTRPRGPFTAQGSALTRNVERSHGSKNLLQRGILYRHEKMVRSTLLQVQGGRQNAQGPILHFVFRDPLCPVIYPHKIHETN